MSDARSVRHGATPVRAASARNWLLLTLLVLGALLAYTSRMALTVIVDPIRHDLNLTDGQIAAVMGGAFAIVYGVSGLFFGWLSERASRTMIIGLALLTWSGATAWTAFAGNFGTLFGSRLVLGAAEACLTPAALSLIASVFPLEKRGLAVGIFLVGIYAGAGGAIMAVGQLVGFLDGIPAAQRLMGLATWRQALLILAVPGLLLTPFILAMKDKRAPLAVEQSPVNIVAALREMPWRAMTPVLAGLALISLSDNAMFSWTPTLLIREHGIAASLAGTMLGAALMVGGGIGVLAGGMLADRVTASRRSIGKLAGFVTLATVPLLLAVVVHRTDIVVIGMGIYITVSGCATAMGWTALIGSVPEGHRGIAASLQTLTSVGIGLGVAPNLVVAASSAAGSIGSGLCIVTVSSMVLAAAVFYFGSRPARAGPSNEFSPRDDTPLSAAATASVGGL